ncbi:MAG: 3-dehydroquinate synthase [Peptococcaceae bacterium BICA1-7]|nr:MAG: 3-dehydroquinate synthase [Peptococcaceae bacterium BICA1-7]HBV98516.1 3-dehydroquinate synthase [Desulfotomaculum sp.]
MVKKQKEIWFDGRSVPLERSDIWGLVNNSPIEKVVVSAEQRISGHFPHKTHLITAVRDTEDLAGLAGGETVFSDSPEVLEEARRQGYRTCVFLSVNDSEALEQSWQEAVKHDYAAVDFDLPTNIPLELIIARLQDSNTVLLRRVSTADDMEVAFGVLEKGSDGVLFSGMDSNEIIGLTSYLRKERACHLELCPLVVTEVRHTGMGSRACIDTTDLMSREEGMIVGSTSGGGILVCSETHFLPYMNLRPFRVNAGAVHSYVWAPNNSTEYITDLAAGSKVLCVNTKGEAREVTVGRVKTEVRPLLLIKGEAAGRELNVVVQDDWHIRIMGADGLPRNASAIRPGDSLLAYLCEPGRHVGIKVDETIIEK